jgi:transcriptional regulator with XRE-family HTH domain
MSDKLNTKQKKEWAYTLYTKENMVIQKQLAAKVGVSENTISRWVRDENWEKYRNNMLLTREEQMQNLLQELVELNESIQLKKAGSRYADSKEADVRRKIIKDIKDLETKANLSEIIQVSTRFTKWLSAFNLEKAKEVSDLLNSFIKENMK